MLHRVRQIIAERHRREAVLPGLDEPAWLMLLDLAASEADGRNVSVTSLCIASFAPATTALRHIEALTALGLLERHADPNDGRRFWMELTEQGVSALAELFSEPGSASQPLASHNGGEGQCGSSLHPQVYTP